MNLRVSLALNWAMVAALFGVMLDMEPGSRYYSAGLIILILNSCLAGFGLAVNTIIRAKAAR